MGGYIATDGETFNNSIEIKDSTFTGVATIGAGWNVADGNAKNGIISISNTEFESEAYIIGGVVTSDGSTGKIYKSTDNIINIGKDVIFTDRVLIFGGYDMGNGSTIENITKGNILNLESKIKVAGIGFFEKMNFILPDDFKISTDTLITFDGTTLEGMINGVDISLTNVKIALDLGDSIFALGDQIVLMENLITGVSGRPFDGVQGKILIDGTTTLESFDGWEFELTLDGDNKLLAEVITLGSTFNRRKSFSESQLASFSLILQSADELADTSSFAALKPDANGVVLFGNASGGKSRYETGSYVDLTGGNVHAGFGYKNEYVVFGAFGEFGTGTYKSHNEATDADIKVDASGDLSYYGGGIVARIDFNKNIFFDTTFHIGQTTNTFSSNNIDRKNEKLTEFDTTSLYYGYSAGLGYKFGIGEQARIELFSKYLADTRQKIKEVAPTTDGVETDSDATEFDTLNSMRVKAGGRYIYNFKSGFNMSFGGDYTIELDGEQKGRTINNEREIEAPTLKGGTASGKLGIGYNSDRFVLDLYGSGYFGVRTGYDGGVKFAYMFVGERTPVPAPEPVKPASVLNESFAGNGGTFKANSSQLTTPTKTRILALSEKIKGLRNQDYVILVMGHTDNKGNKIKNKKLSLARARSFKNELVKNGIDEKRIMAVGNGDEAPIATNKTAAGREQNRRVEIEVTNKNEWKNMNWDEIDNELADEKRRKEVENESSNTKNKNKSSKTKKTIKNKVK
ncbi:MAG: autotransporter outer membrane beta-barrel domain-containing protein [Rickettsiales bacterium]|nr:MAG: autotransporter outer membrane beta-barrel domain-containing protein [Rickettsiales bacterium]